MGEEKKFPTINKKLIQVLKEIYPDKIPQRYVDSYELGILVGQQQVIQKLEAEREYQERESL